MTPVSLTQSVKAEAHRLGFNLSGVCPAVTPAGIHHFGQWLSAGYAGQMHYLPNRADAYGHPRSILDGARSIVMLAMNYRTAAANETAAGQGRVACYAWGAADYHDVIHQRLRQLREFVLHVAPQANVRGVVDTAPLLERDFAQLSGLGWIGKNTMLINKRIGSWFFLAALLTDLELEYDRPFEADHCGTCRACLDACPTAAFPQPYVLDARKCISYLTIELRERIPLDQRSGIGDWLFGCDICQDVCPWNHRAPTSSQPGFQPRPDANPADLIALFELDEAAFRGRFRHTPLWRSKRRGILRNAAIVLGNRPAPGATEALQRGLNDVEPLVRGACAWALGRSPAESARNTLEARQAVETDEHVREEIDFALSRNAAGERQTSSGTY